MTVITQINDLIDSYGNYTNCKGCSICKKIEKLSNELKRPSPEVKFKHILQKGKDMTKKEIAKMLDYGLSKKSLRIALKINANDFTVLMQEWGFSGRSEKERGNMNLTTAEYLKFKEEGLSDVKIAQRLGVAKHTLGNWKYRNRIKGQVTTAEQADVEVSKKSESNTTKTDKQAENKASCNCVSEVDSLKTERDNYLNQLIASRHDLVQMDYQLENMKKDFENVDKTIKRYAKENKALRELLSLWI